MSLESLNEFLSVKKVEKYVVVIFIFEKCQGISERKG